MGNYKKKRGKTNLTNAINKVAKEEARRADEELLPPGSIRKRDTEQRPCLLFVPHLVNDRPIKNQSKNNQEKKKSLSRLLAVALLHGVPVFNIIFYE